LGLYSISHIEELTGIKSHTIRIWEKRYNMFTPDRTDTKIRVYNDDDLKQLLNISFLNKHGFKISKIAEMDKNQLDKEITKFLEVGQNEEAFINQLIVSMINLDEVAFEQVMDKLITNFGLEKAILEVIYPFLRRVGVMWLTNNILPYQEHFISNLVRQKIIVGIDKIKITNESKAPKVVLYLPEWELHEIGLLLSHYRFKMMGFRTYYLGPSVPQKDLEEVIKLIQPNIVFSIFTVHRPQEFLEQYTINLSVTNPETNFTITTNQFEGFESKNKNLTVFNDLIETLKFVCTKLVS
jgi:MerR family transcriptional regulator, light-induced transcriptional regulator